MSAINQNNTGCISWCQNQTNRISSPLPAQKKLIEVILRILIIASIIIPLVGLIANCTCSKKVPEDKLKEKFPQLWTMVDLYQSGLEGSDLQKTYTHIYEKELGLDGTEEVNPTTIFQKIKHAIGLSNELSTSKLYGGRTFGYFVQLEDQHRLIVAFKAPTAQETSYLRTNIDVQESITDRLFSEDTLEEKFPVRTRIRVSPAITDNKRIFNSKLPQDQAYNGALESNIALLAHILPPLTKQNPNEG